MGNNTPFKARRAQINLVRDPISLQRLTFSQFFVRQERNLQVDTIVQKSPLTSECTTMQLLHVRTFFISRVQLL